MPTANLPGDLTLYYEDDAYTDPWREAETVILQHGQAKSSALWYAWVPLLARDYRVIRVDARGYGRSSVPPKGYHWSLEGFADDLRNLMDYLGIAKAHLIGETVGGTFALAFALRHPERTHTLTACQSPYKFRGNPMYPAYQQTVREQGVEAWVKANAGRRLTPGEVDPAFEAWYSGVMCQTDRRTVEGTLGMLADVDLTDGLTGVSVPVLTIAGELSDSVARSQELAAKVPQGAYRSVPGVSGFVQHEAPEACVAIWRAWVQGLSLLA